MDIDIAMQMDGFKLLPLEAELLNGLLLHVEPHLDDILGETRAIFAKRPPVAEVFAAPQVHALRRAHWQLVLTGRFDEVYLASARVYMQALVDREVPAACLVPCHKAVRDAVLKTISPHYDAFFPTRRRAAFDALKTALAKAVWLDVERLLIAYEAVSLAKRQHVLNGLAATFETAIGSIVQSVSVSADDLTLAAQTMSATSRQATDQTAAIAAATYQASVSIQSVASAADELATSIAEIGMQVQEAAHVASQASTQAEETSGQMRDLSNAAQKIGDVVDLINSIAGQTNLLALNATIEAARAGDSGRGFAVVAAEVKQLAHQTARATSEIGSQIGGIQNSTGNSVMSISEISGVINRLNMISNSVSAAVLQQQSATQEIARNVQEVSSGTQEVSENINGVSRAANEAAATAEQVLGSAKDLASNSSALEREVSVFLAQIRAA